MSRLPQNLLCRYSNRKGFVIPIIKVSPVNKLFTIRNVGFASAAAVILLALIIAGVWFWSRGTTFTKPLLYTSTIAGTNGEVGEPFGLAMRGEDVYISDGQNDEIWRISASKTSVFAAGLDTPSGIAFDKDGNLIVADSGSHTIKSINAKGEVTTIAGITNRSGFADGDAATALFNAPIGVAVIESKIYVTDTYNDRIRVIEYGKVSTLAGIGKGFANGDAATAKFDTPTGIAIWQDKLIVADTGNNRIRVVEPNGEVWTLAGTGESDLKDSLLLQASFIQPTELTVSKDGTLFITDGNAVRKISGDVIPIVTTLSYSERGIADGNVRRSRFNRPSGLAIDNSGNLIVTDSENRLVRRISSENNGTMIPPEQIVAMRETPDYFRNLQPPRWPYDPPTAKRDIAGTLGEIRGDVKPGNDDLHFHNGLDIAGAYGETARFVREEKVLRPIAAENFGTLRELLRMPTMGYIHIRLGRNAEGYVNDDPRFIFSKDATGKLDGVRVPRGAKFKAGEPIGTLNPMNHVHLIAGRSGSEMNALDALILPGIADTRPPVIEKVTLFDKNWQQIEAVAGKSVPLRDPIRIVVRTYDQLDGNSDRRRLGVYKVGYQILKSDGSPLSDEQWTIKFDRLPGSRAVRLVYADGSHSDATGETIFNYIATNRVDGDDYKEDFFDASTLANGSYILRAFSADYFGNTTHLDTAFEVSK